MFGNAFFLKSRSVWYCLFFVLIFCTPSCSSKQTSSGVENSYYGAVVDTILNKSGKKFNIKKTEGITFYYEPDKYFDSVMQTLITDAERSKKQCMEMLGLTTLPYEMKIIYFNDREKIRPYLNMAPKGIALPDAYSLLIATNDSIRAYHTHEMMHIISINHFGGYAATPSDWIQEGISVYTDNPCLGHPIHEIAAYLYYNNKMSSMDSLFHHFRSLPDMQAYIQAGSLVGFLVDTYGLKKFEKIWENGIVGLSSIIGKSINELEKEYHAFLRKNYPTQPKVNWTLLNEKGCG